VQNGEQALSKNLTNALETYNRNRENLLDELYEGNRRGTPLLDGGGLGWLDGNRDALLDAVRETSTNRLEAYDDEAAILSAARKALESKGRSDLSGAVDSLEKRVAGEKELDERLYRGNQADSASEAGATGATGALERAVEQ
ncbi:MAG: hypothetical protein IIB57_02300, partial [Planctomycetes bacterium]|nr:hypothetical protein [Planctomycetota bacterium]